MFAWQIVLCLLNTVLDWTEQLHLCAKTYSLANVSRIFSRFLQSMKINWRASFKNWERINGPIGQTSTSRSGVRMWKNEHMTYENFLPGQQKKQHITQSIKQMRMVSISSSLKHLVPMTKLLRRRSGGEMEKGLWWSSIWWRPSMNYTSKSALSKHASIKKARMEKCKKCLGYY